MNIGNAEKPTVGWINTRDWNRDLPNANPRLLLWATSRSCGSKHSSTAGISTFWTLRANSSYKWNKNKFVALQPRRAKTESSRCCQMAVQGALLLAKRLSLNLYFSFLNRISLLIIWSSYPIVLTRLGGPRFRPYTSRKISRIQPGIESGTYWMTVRRSNHYTKQADNSPYTFNN